MTRVMVVHPGMAHSVSDVYDGLLAGLRAQGVDVVPFAWGEMLKPFSALTSAAIRGEQMDDQQAQRLREFAVFVASADAVSVALDADVDAVIVVNGLLFPPSRAQVLRKLGIPIACIGTEAPYFLKEEQQIAPFYSHWFTNERTCERLFDTPTVYLPHAYNPERHQPGAIDPDCRADVVFVGGGYPERKALLAGVDWAGIDHAVHGTLWNLDVALEVGVSDFARNERWTEGAIPNELTSAWHRSSKIALNMHRTMAHLERGDTITHICESLGPRAYEITACRGFMLCDDERPEIDAIYGDSAATFAAWNSASLEREIRWWLHHPDMREEWQAAQAERVRPHHWGARASTILDTIFA